METKVIKLKNESKEKDLKQEIIPELKQENEVFMFTKKYKIMAKLDTGETLLAEDMYEPNFSVVAKKLKAGEPITNKDILNTYDMIEFYNVKLLINNVEIIINRFGINPNKIVWIADNSDDK
jgi:hypothetical protein